MGKKNQKISPDVERAIISAYEMKDEIDEISNRFDVNPMTIYEILHRNGLWATRTRVVTDEERKAVIFDYNSGAATKEVATKYGLSRGTVRKILHKADIVTKSGPPVGYKHTDEAREKISAKQSGEKHHGWKGGIRRDKNGYVIIRGVKRDGTRAGYQFEHRFVMEQLIGRKLKSEEYVHHINGIKDDNRPENLMILQSKMHFGTVECPYCQGVFLVK